MQLIYLYLQCNCITSALGWVPWFHSKANKTFWTYMDRILWWNCKKVYKCNVESILFNSVMWCILWCFFRLPGASNQKCVHSFLFQIADHYKEKLDFVFDILKVDVPELFAEVSQQDEAAVTNFVRDLKKFIVQCKLKHRLLTEMKEILVRNHYFFSVINFKPSNCIPLHCRRGWPRRVGGSTRLFSQQFLRLCCYSGLKYAILAVKPFKQYIYIHSLCKHFFINFYLVFWKSLGNSSIPQGSARD